MGAPRRLQGTGKRRTLSWLKEPEGQKVPAGLDRKTYKRVYRLLEKVTPLREDCGALCGKLCCRPVRPETGIYLFPGEEAMLRGTEEWLEWTEQQAQEYDFPPSWRGPVYFVRCHGHCPREKRPLQCRFFPLTAHYLPEGHLVLIWETVALPYRCPLLGGRFPLEQAFIEAVAKAWELLLQHPLIEDLVRWDARARQQAARRVVPLTPRPAKKAGGTAPWQIVKVVRFAQ